MLSYISINYDACWLTSISDMDNSLEKKNNITDARTVNHVAKNRARQIHGLPVAVSFGSTTMQLRPSYTKSYRTKPFHSDFLPPKLSALTDGQSPSTPAASTIAQSLKFSIDSTVVFMVADPNNALLILENPEKA